MVVPSLALSGILLMTGSFWQPSALIHPRNECSTDCSCSAHSRAPIETYGIPRDAVRGPWVRPSLRLRSLTLEAFECCSPGTIVLPRPEIVPVPSNLLGPLTVPVRDEGKIFPRLRWSGGGGRAKIRPSVTSLFEAVGDRISPPQSVRFFDRSIFAPNGVYSDPTES